MTDNNIRSLILPPGIYFIVNPYQESHGVVAKLAGAVQRPNNIYAAHSGLHPIYAALQQERLGISVCVAVFWFGDAYQYNAVLVGPLGNGPNYEEQLQMVKNATERASVPHDWTQVVLFLGD